jgi:hypothetical protein
MDEQFNAKIRVVRTSDTGEVSDVAPEQFREPDVDKIASVTNQFVINLQNNLKVGPEERTPQILMLSEIELAFGIDFEVEAEAELKVPIIGPRIRGGVRGGATFEVHIKLSRGDS